MSVSTFMNITSFDPGVLINPANSKIKYIKIDKCLADQTLSEYFGFIRKLKEEAYSKPYKVLEPNDFPRELEKLK